MWFVMLRAGRQGILPLVHADETVALFETEEQAAVEAEKNPLGHAYGYEVYETSVVREAIPE